METLAEAVTRTPLLTGTSVEQKREEIRRYFHHTFSLYESLFDCINSDQAYFLRPEPLRHPLIFYFGHTAVFFINKLLLGKYPVQRLNDRLESMFAIGVDEMSWDDLSRAHYDWPSVAETRTYRDQVRQVVDTLISEMPLTLPITHDSPAWIILMGIEHERIHLETSSVIMRRLPLEYLTAHPPWAACSDTGPAPENSLLPVAGETITLGKPATAHTYGWDNEYGQKTVAVQPFKVAKYLVSNGEYLAFVKAGGSWISTGNEATRYARYAFRRHFFQHAGFRYIESNSPEVPVEAVNSYETDELVAQYLEFHYGDSYFGVANYSQACVQALLSHTIGLNHGKALDLGCSVGRASFELAQHFDHVDGIDFSARFIRHGFQLKATGHTRFSIPIEGDLVEFKEVSLPALGYAGLGDKIDFVQGDACNLKARFRDYDLIFCGNLIDRLYDPGLFLTRIHQRLNAGGYLVLTSPYTWLEQYTPKDKWLGGIKNNGENVTTLDGLSAALGQHFNLVAQQDVPFVLRETRRKFQHTLADMTVWQLK